MVASTALRSINFFNGRLLTGDDLRLEQETGEARLERLGRLTGEGIAYGFEVEQAIGSDETAPVVTVAGGLALTRSGIALELPAAVDVALHATDPAAGAEPGNLFADCQPHAPGTYTPGKGVYLLVVGPAEKPEGRAEVSGLGNEAAACNTARSAEALKFRVIRLALEPAVLADRKRLRNVVAYRCFGADATAAFFRDPFGASPSLPGDLPPRYGLVDTLRTQILTDDEVPLATIGWTTADGIDFVDLWSVRRRLTQRSPDDGWAPLTGARRRAEAEAMVLQFQTHVGDLRVAEVPQQLVASDHFRNLPPAGLLPVGAHPSQGFDTLKFFSGLPFRDPATAVLEGSRAAELLFDAFSYPPIDLTREEPELVWLYLIRENIQPFPPGPLPRRYVLFTNGQIPYRADARFELSYWNFANYAEVD
jgi:hypothetical protein